MRLAVLDRDLNVRDFVTFPDEAVDNSIAIDEHNGIYVVTSRRMLKVIWNGESLSTDEADGAWESGYEWIPDDEALAAGSISRGSGTTPSLMGFGDDSDKLVVIADAPEGAPIWWGSGATTSRQTSSSAPERSPDKSPTKRRSPSPS